MQVVNPRSRVSNAWLPIALIVVALGVMVCAFAASRGNFFSIFGGTPTPAPPPSVATGTPSQLTPTLGPIIVVTGTITATSTIQPTDTPTEVAPTDTPIPPTDTPFPTIEVPPTVTPVPPPTDTPK